MTFGWTYFIKKLIVTDVFHLTLALSNYAKKIYILHLQDEKSSKRFQKITTNLIHKVILKATSIPIEKLRAYG